MRPLQLLEDASHSRDRHLKRGVRINLYTYNCTFQLYIQNNLSAEHLPQPQRSPELAKVKLMSVTRKEEAISFQFCLQHAIFIAFYRQNFEGFKVVYITENPKQHLNKTPKPDPLLSQFIFSM